MLNFHTPNHLCDSDRAQQNQFHRQRVEGELWRGGQQTEIQDPEPGQDAPVEAHEDRSEEGFPSTGAPT